MILIRLNIISMTVMLMSTLICAGCSNNETNGCEFTKATLTASQVGTDKELSKKEFTDCFKRINDGTLVEVKGDKTGNNFKVLYYKEADPDVTKMLTINVGGHGSDWRANKGHDIIKVDKADSLGFIFGDRIKTKMKGTVMFTK